MGNEYTYISNRRGKEIITTQKGKIKNGFTYVNGMYYKAVDEKELTDIYVVEFLVKYKSAYNGVSDWWKLGSEQNVIEDNKLRLIFAEGVLPSWTIVDKNVCSAMIPLDKILEAKMVISYIKRDGVALEERITEERIIPIKELKQLHDGYCRMNL